MVWYNSGVYVVRSLDCLEYSIFEDIPVGIKLLVDVDFLFGLGVGPSSDDDLVFAFRPEEVHALAAKFHFEKLVRGVLILAFLFVPNHLFDEFLVFGVVLSVGGNKFLLELFEMCHQSRELPELKYVSELDAMSKIIVDDKECWFFGCFLHVTSRR